MGKVCIPWKERLIVIFSSDINLRSDLGDDLMKGGGIRWFIRQLAPLYISVIAYVFDAQVHEVASRNQRRSCNYSHLIYTFAKHSARSRYVTYVLWYAELFWQLPFRNDSISKADKNLATVFCRTGNFPDFSRSQKSRSYFVTLRSPLP